MKTRGITGLFVTFKPPIVVWKGIKGFVLCVINKDKLLGVNIMFCLNVKIQSLLSVEGCTCQNTLLMIHLCLNLCVLGYYVLSALGLYPTALIY